VTTIPYVYREGKSLVRKDLASPDYHYETYDWYLLPRELRVPVWTEPYFDEGGGESLMVTYSVPIFTRPSMEFRGIVTGDVALSWLKDMMESMKLGPGGYAFLVSRNGSFIHHPRAELVMRESIFSVAEERQDPKLREFGRSMARGDSKFIEFASLLTGEPSWAAYAPVPGTGWALAAVFPKRVMTAKLFDLVRMKVLLGGVGLLALFGVALWIAHSITRPIRALEGAAHRLAGGNLDAELPVAEGNDEIARLSRSFSVMQHDLKRHIADLQEATRRARAHRDRPADRARHPDGARAQSIHLRSAAARDRSVRAARAGARGGRRLLRLLLAEQGRAVRRGGATSPAKACRRRCSWRWPRPT
jgi:sigma-B regulation protein RsbU (phosphoserine phosphatase)